MTLPASATQYRAATIPTVAAQRAAELTRLPNMSRVRDFTVITRSKAPADIATLSAYFRSFGFVVTDQPGRHDLLLHGTFAQAAASARTGFVAASRGTERYVRTSSAVTFPAKIAALVSGTSFTPGLRAHPLSARRLAEIHGPTSGYGPGDIAGLYDINPIYAAGVIGTDLNVAIAACSTVNPSDVVNYGATYGLPPAKIHYVAVDGTTTEEDGEAVLDAERVYGTAPGATIYEYLAPDCTDDELTDMFAKIAEDDVKYHFAAVSHSYGLDEADYAYFGVPQDIASESAAFAEIAAEHVPIFVASGDDGAWGDLYENETDVSYPASDPNAIAVGGTSVEENAVGGRLFEYGWGDSGGGVSDIFPIPSYQRIAGVASSQFKNLPDVAMLGDPDTGAAEYWANNYYGAPPLFAIGGTSVAAPTFTGAWTLVDAVRRKAGLKYPQYSAASIYRVRGSAFYDVVSGANGFYPAQKGYDNVTGIGAPDVAKLATAPLQ
ncbi:MAG: S8 family serine peptidase [Candidatus Eremiobacteraeota bacterium]|nr:S8 family serine peptidase [Candidatus Eremiobacteraeota bacterium]